MSETKIVTQRLDTASANIAMGSNKITGLGNGTASTDAAAFGQVTPLFNYRRPNLVYSSGTVVTVETGIVTGTSGDATILFPDGQLRTETSSTRYNVTISQNAVFTNATLGSNQGGLRTGSVANNTWYALYAVKVTTFAANWVLVADIVHPLVENFAALNSNFGTNGWIYLGMIRYGFGGGTIGILNFIQSGAMTSFVQPNADGNAASVPGVLFVTSASATDLTYTYVTGSLGAQVPSVFSLVVWAVSKLGDTLVFQAGAQTSSTRYLRFAGIASSVTTTTTGYRDPVQGLTFNTSGAAGGMDIHLSAFVDRVLGVGSNPLF